MGAGAGAKQRKFNGEARELAHGHKILFELETIQRELQIARENLEIEALP